jgi:predicted dehydrogenase
MRVKTVNVVVIGAGLRSRNLVSRLLGHSRNNIRIIGVYDPDKVMCEEAIKQWNYPGVKICQSYLEAVQLPEAEWVMVFSPNVFHKEQILAAFDNNKHVFAEKPLAITIEDCLKISEAHRRSKLQFAIGLTLRYAPIYQKAKEILSSGVLGNIISINADENIACAHGGFIMTNWRRNRSHAGPYILEKCCHDLDLLNYFCESLPSKVAAFAGLDFFIPKNLPLRDQFGDKAFYAWVDRHRESNAFESDKSIEDTLVSIIEYRNKIKVVFQATMSNALPERRMYFSCTKGTMILELYGACLEYKTIGDENSLTFKFESDDHGGGDNFIMSNLYMAMTNHAKIQCGVSEGISSAIFALSIDQAARESKIVDIEPVWKKYKL